MDQFFHSEVFSKLARTLEIPDQDLSSSLRKAKDAYERAKAAPAAKEEAEADSDEKLNDLPVLLRGVSRRLRDLSSDTRKSLAWTAGQVVHDQWDEGIEDDDNWLTEVQTRVDTRLEQVSKALGDLELLAAEALKTPFFNAAAPEDVALVECVQVLRDFWESDLGRTFPSRDNFTRVESPDEIKSLPDFGPYLARLFEANAAEADEDDTAKGNGSAENAGALVPKSDAAKFLTLCVGLIDHKTGIEKIHNATIRASVA